MFSSVCCQAVSYDSVSFVFFSLIILSPPPEIVRDQTADDAILSAQQSRPLQPGLGPWGTDRHQTFRSVRSIQRSEVGHSNFGGCGPRLWRELGGSLGGGRKSWRKHQQRCSSLSFVFLAFPSNFWHPNSPEQCCFCFRPKAQARIVFFYRQIFLP